MRANIIKIGNSQGIRIPKTVLQQCDIQNEVDIEIKGKIIMLKPFHKKAREGWTEAFKLMKKNKDDKLLINDDLDLQMENWKW
ncbi:MAG: hypothetical protein BWY90_00128 [Deltaproteobacteria bacterium ADurb.BinA014]|nr:MAG: hypothetical protein BWY90_00128 [Deltaproteobacteria bacterium ADurb.BinA014]